MLFRIREPLAAPNFSAASGLYGQPDTIVPAVFSEFGRIFCGVKRRKKPGFPLQFLKIASRFLRDFRFYPLRGLVPVRFLPSCRNLKLGVILFNNLT
jgi:hypothetical protein